MDSLTDVKSTADIVQRVGLPVSLCIVFSAALIYMVFVQQRESASDKEFQRNQSKELASVVMENTTSNNEFRQAIREMHETIKSLEVSIRN